MHIVPKRLTDQRNRVPLVSLPPSPTLPCHAARPMSEGNQENAARLGRLSIVGFLRKHTCYSTMPESGKVHTHVCPTLKRVHAAVSRFASLPPLMSSATSPQTSPRSLPSAALLPRNHPTFSPT